MALIFSVNCKQLLYACFCCVSGLNVWQESMMQCVFFQVCSVYLHCLSSYFEKMSEQYRHSMYIAFSKFTLTFSFFSCFIFILLYIGFIVTLCETWAAHVFRILMWTYLGRQRALWSCGGEGQVHVTVACMKDICYCFIDIFIGGLLNVDVILLLLLYYILFVLQSFSFRIGTEVLHCVASCL